MRWLGLFLALAVGCSGVVGGTAGEDSADGEPTPGAPASRPGGPTSGASPMPAPGPAAPGAPPAAPPAPGGSVCGRLEPLEFPSLQDLPFAPGARLRVRAVPAFTPPPGSPWSWTVAFGEGLGVELPVTRLDETATTVEFPIERAGRYQIRARLRTAAGDTCALEAIGFAPPSDRRFLQLRARVVPPPALARELQVPTQELPLQILAGATVPRPLSLLRATEVQIAPVREGTSSGVPSYVRLSHRGGFLSVEGHVETNTFRALLLPAPAAYDLLVVPSDDIAPAVFSNRTPPELNVLRLALDPGREVTGRLLDAAGAPVADARVVLRAPVPGSEVTITSTVGRSDAGGAFTLRVRDGTFAVTAAPPPARGLPEAVIPVDPGLAVAGALRGAELRWAAVPTAQLTVAVRVPDGRDPAGARVWVELATPLPDAAALTVPRAGAPLVLKAQGLARATATAGADGVAALPPLPRGRYRVLVVPPDRDATTAMASTTIDLTVDQRQTVTLGPRVALRGVLGPRGETVGARIHAVPRAADPPRAPVSAEVRADGSYDLRVDPGRDYLVWADPGAGGRLARCLLGVFSAGADGGQVLERSLPTAQPVEARVIAYPDRPLPGALVQVFCQPGAADCADPTVPLAEAVAGANGACVLNLPAP